MAGSKRWFRYRSDNGLDYSVQLDESNSEATSNSIRLMPARTAAHPLLGKGQRMRYVLASTPAPVSVAPAASGKTVSRKFWIGDLAALAAVQAGNPIIASVYPGLAAVNWSVGTIQGEKNRVPPALNAAAGDSGLDDGDQGQDQA